MTPEPARDRCEFIINIVALYPTAWIRLNAH